MPPLRVAFLTTTPSPYIQDMFSAMVRDGRIAPRVFFMEKAAPAFSWTENDVPDFAEILAGKWFHFLGGRIHLNRGAIGKIDRSKPDVVVVGGYNGLTSQMVMYWLIAQRIPWIFWGEIPGMSRRRHVGAALRWLAMRPAVRFPDGIAAIGARAADAYRRAASKNCLVRNIPYFTDLDPFFAIPREEEDSKNRAVRFLYCGQLIVRKGVDLLLQAFCDVASRHPFVTLTFVGDGPLEEHLKRSVPERLRDRVTFTGFQQVEDLPRYFGQGDVLVLPSLHDGWGVVVNQALAAGMGIVCSDAVGASVDLVTENVNGRVVAAGDQSALASCLESIAADPELSRAFGRASRILAHEWTPARSVDRWYDLFKSVLARRT